MRWQDIPADYRAVAEAALLPNPAFVEEQRFWFARWWLACTQADVDAINAVLPESVQVAPIEIEGSLYLGSDLLTDSMQPGQTYYAAQAIVQGLICTYFDTPPQE
jgi:hypothetical protein